MLTSEKLSPQCLRLRAIMSRHQRVAWPLRQKLTSRTKSQLKLCIIQRFSSMYANSYPLTWSANNIKFKLSFLVFDCLIIIVCRQSFLIVWIIEFLYLIQETCMRILHTHFILHSEFLFKNLLMIVNQIRSQIA